MNNFEKIKQIVKRIPAGKVTTYGTVAKLAGINDARQVGWAIWGNQDKNIPCHRVVNKEGKLAEKFSLGGWQEQKIRLLADGIKFSQEKIVDLKKYYWDGAS
ncbi:DNA base-flipping protein [Patescibacteria group bacterium]|nr:DNA base-flipping protein [Patescibacteria group bacterium]